MAETVARRVVVTGRVQGVGFRWSARRAAERVGARGWVRNRADGAVEAQLEGDAHAVAELEAWFARGPSGARVDAVEAADSEPQGAGGFEVRR